MKRLRPSRSSGPACRLGLVVVVFAVSASLLSGQRPPNDDFESATVIEGIEGVADGTTVGATWQAGEPDHDGQPAAASVWWWWSAPTHRPVHFFTTSGGSQFDFFPMRLAVYAGSDLTDLVVIAQGGPEEPFGSAGVTFSPVAATTYMIAVDLDASLPVEDRRGVYLSWFSAPENDLFSDAIELVGLQGSATGTNGGATLEWAEPLLGGETPEHRERWGSVWWKWTAPRDVTLTIDTFGSGFDTKLAVYTGEELASLTDVASNDDSTIPNNFESTLTFNAVAGVSYKILVDGFSPDGSAALGARGTIVLNWGPALKSFDISSLPDGRLRFRLECSPEGVGYIQRGSDLKAWADWRPFRVGQEGRVTLDAGPGEVPNQYYRCRIVWP